MIPVWQEARMIEANITHSETVSLNGETWTGPNAEGDCARALIGAGVEPGELLVFSRNGVPALRGTVAAFAGRAWGGADADSQFRRWRPRWCRVSPGAGVQISQPSGECAEAVLG
jgi:hypothetical protein